MWIHRFYLKFKYRVPPYLINAMRRENIKEIYNYILHEQKVISECLFCPTGLNVSYFLNFFLSKQCVVDLFIYVVFSIVNSDVCFSFGGGEIY